MVSACMQHFQLQKVSKQQSNAGIYRVPDSVRFDQVQITDVPEPVPVHMCLDHTITKNIPKVILTTAFRQVKVHGVLPN